VSSVIDLVQAAFEANPIYWAGIEATPRGAQARATVRDIAELLRAHDRGVCDTERSAPRRRH